MIQEKTYTFIIKEIARVYGVVQASSLEEAAEKVKRYEWDDLIDAVDIEYDTSELQIHEAD